METPAKNKLDRLAAALTLTYAHNSLTSLKCKHRIWDLLLLTEPSRPLTPQFNSNKIPSSLPPCCFLLLLPSPPSSCPITFHSLATFLLIFSYLWSPMLLFACSCPAYVPWKSIPWDKCPLLLLAWNVPSVSMTVSWIWMNELRPQVWLRMCGFFWKLMN